MPTPTPQPGDPGFDWSTYGSYKANPANDPLNAAKDFLAKPDFFNPDQTNAAAAVKHINDMGAQPKGEAPISPEEGHSFLTGMIPGVAAGAALVGANVLFPEITVPAEMALGAGVGGASAAATGTSPVSGAIQGAAAGVPWGKPLEWAGKGMQSAMDMLPPWWGREMLARMVGLGEGGQAAAVAGPPVVNAIGKGMESAGETLGEDSIPGKIASWFNKITGRSLPDPEPYAPNVSGYEGPTPSRTGPFEPSSLQSSVDQHMPNASGYTGSGTGGGVPPTGSGGVGPYEPESFTSPASQVDRYAPNTPGYGNSAPPPSPPAPQGPEFTVSGATAPDYTARQVADAASMGRSTINDMRSSGYQVPATGFRTSMDAADMAAAERANPIPAGMRNLPNPEVVAPSTGAPQAQPGAQDVQSLIDELVAHGDFKTGATPTSLPAPEAAPAPAAAVPQQPASLRALDRGDEFWGPGTTNRSGAVSMAGENNRILYDPQTPTEYIRQQFMNETDPAQKEFLRKALSQRYAMAARPGKAASLAALAR